MFSTVSNASKTQRRDRGKEFVIRKAEMAGTQHVDRDADEVEHDGRHVEHVVGPVAPAGEESVKVAEDFFGPEIDSAFAGITVGEFDDGDALRPEEKKQGDDPEPDGDAAVGGDGGNDVEVEDGDYEEQDEIAASEGADQVRLSCGLGGGGQSLLLQSASLRLADSDPACTVTRAFACMQGRPRAPVPTLTTLSARPALAGRRVPAALSRAMRRCRRRQRGAYRCRPRCAGRRSSTARPTSKVAPSRRG